MTRFIEENNKIYAVRLFPGARSAPAQDMYQRVASVTAPFRRRWQGTVQSADHAFEHPREHARIYPVPKRATARAAGRHRKVQSVPYVPDPNAPPLKDVVRDLFASARELERLDDEIGQLLADFEDVIRKRRPTGYPVDVPFPPWGKLGWSGRRGHWRLVVLEDEDTCPDLRQMPRDCRADACNLLLKLAERMGLL